MRMKSTNRFSQNIRIGPRTVGAAHPTFFIADIGANFDGSLEKAKRLALAARDAGADAAKFQSFLADKIVSGRSFATLKLKGVHGSWKKPVEEVFRSAEFPRAWHKEISDYCRRIGIIFSSAPYDVPAVDLLDTLGVPFFKIGSGEITWHEMLRYIARKGKPVILATGDSTLAEVDEAVRVIEETGNRELILLQCITNYPSRIESANLNVLKTYQTAFGLITGYSDHAAGDLVPLASVALGGRVIEKHFTLSKRDMGPDHPHSMEPAEFRQMVQRIRLLEQALGSGKKEVAEEESETVVVQRRSLHLVRAVKKGEILRARDIVSLRPAIGIAPNFKSLVVGARARRFLAAREALRWGDLV